MEDLYVDGVVEGTITLPANRLTVGPNAHLKADVNAHEVVIHGAIDGNLRSTGRIELRETAVVKGDLAAERLSIEENATIEGRVDLTEPKSVTVAELRASSSDVLAAETTGLLQS
jgi:cytoskeletal protein CcmA (bactofilin family)